MSATSDVLTRARCWATGHKLPLMWVGGFLAVVAVVLPWTRKAVNAAATLVVAGATLVLARRELARGREEQKMADSELASHSMGIEIAILNWGTDAWRDELPGDESIRKISKDIVASRQRIEARFDPLVRRAPAASPTVSRALHQGIAMFHLAQVSFGSCASDGVWDYVQANGEEALEEFRDKFRTGIKRTAEALEWFERVPEEVWNRQDSKGMPMQSGGFAASSTAEE